MDSIFETFLPIIKLAGHGSDEILRYRNIPVVGRLTEISRGNISSWSENTSFDLDLFVRTTRYKTTPLAIDGRFWCTLRLNKISDEWSFVVN